LQLFTLAMQTKNKKKWLTNILPSVVTLVTIYNATNLIIASLPVLPVPLKLWLCGTVQMYHRLHGSGSTVVTMTSKVNAKTEILTPCRPERLKPPKLLLVII